MPRTVRPCSLFGQRHPIVRIASSLLGLLMLAMMAAVQAQTFSAPAISPMAIVPPAFDMTGFIQDATLDTSNAICKPTHARLAGGTVTLNGIKVIIPCNTVLQLPAATLSWADLFRAGTGFAPADIAPAGQTGLAIGDRIGAVIDATIKSDAAGLLGMKTVGSSSGLQTRSSSSLPSYEIRVVGNVVRGRYIAGLVFISQQSLNTSTGVISCIDYASGEMQVGGVPVDAVTSGCPSTVAPGVSRVRLNDANGRFGKRHAPVGQCGGDANCVEQAGFDARFAPDTDNPTVHASTGYPMCIPRRNPFSEGVDALCPQSNRPVAPACPSFGAGSAIPPFPAQQSGYCTMFVMALPNAPVPSGKVCPGPGCPTDPMRQAPLQIGDTITYQGTLKADARGFYVAAHTINANLGIYTQPNSKPAYVLVEEVLAGTAALPLAGLAQEATERVRFVGFTTDPTSLIDLFALDVDPVAGYVSERHLTTQSAMATAQLGRFRTPGNNGGVFLPPTRMYRAISRALCAGTTGPYAVCRLEGNGDASRHVAANGLVAGQYSLPNFNYIFAENLTFGQALVPNNFQDMAFLFCGSGPLDGAGTQSPVVGQLDPAPWGAPMQDPIFRSTICPNARAVAAALVFPPVKGLPDRLLINNATWDNKNNTAKLTVTAISSASPAPAGMFMTATISNAWMTPGAPGGVDNPIVAQMTLAFNSLAEPTNCPTAAPCWKLSAPGFIIDPMTPPFAPELVPPTNITVRSSLGGTVSIADSQIRLISCVSTKKFTCP
jgi:hypothetical protein